VDKLIVRASEPSDWDWLYGLHEAAHRALVEQAYGPWVEAQQRDFFGPVVSDHEVSVLERDGQRVGAVYLGLREGDTWLELIEVDPDSQGGGLGTWLLGWVVDRSVAAGRGTLLQVHKVNERARSLYLRTGFIPAGETPTHHLLRHPGVL
jgi:GNAT superfamily N-acetyltransferase